MKTEIKITCDCNAEGLGALLQTLEKLQSPVQDVQEVSAPVKEGTTTSYPVTDVTSPDTTNTNKPEPEPVKTEAPTRKEMIALCAKYKDSKGIDKLREQFTKLDPKACKFADLSQDRWPELKELLSDAN